MTIKNDLWWLKAMPTQPSWTECEKRLLAWMIAAEGWIYVDGKQNPQIGVCMWHKGTMKRLYKIAQLGQLYEKSTQHEDRKRWSWEVAATREIANACMTEAKTE